MSASLIFLVLLATGLTALWGSRAAWQQRQCWFCGSWIRAQVRGCRYCGRRQHAVE
jgi:hypothetical protein